MAQLALIIGNGFDIDLGLPSRYSDFVESPEFNDLERRFHSLYYSEERDRSLIRHISRAANESNWFDIEEEIHKYMIYNTSLNERDVKHVRSEFDGLKKALTAYLKRVSTNLEHKADKSKLAYQLKYKLQYSPLSKIDIYFNYTTSELFLGMPTYHEIGKGLFTYVHGSLRYDDIVLGCDLQPGELVNRQLSFMYKYNQLHHATQIARHLLEAREIIFFGHSVNEMDFCYFKEFFKVASSSPTPQRHLTFITYDEEAERTIKDNIRNQGISVSDLYSNLETLDFIHTKRVYENKEEEVLRWNEFMSRISTRHQRGVRAR